MAHDLCHLSIGSAFHFSEHGLRPKARLGRVLFCRQLPSIVS